MQGEWKEAERAARAALATATGTAALAAATFEPVAGSLSNFAWHASAPGQDCFVRYARVGSEQLGADLYAESRILGFVAEAGLAPPVVRCDPASRLLVTQWIGSATVDLTAAGLERTLRQTAAMLRRLHQLAPLPGMRTVDMAAQMRQLEAALPTEVERLALTACAVEAMARLGPGRTTALCHHDIHAQNLLVDPAGRLWLVDWEYAGLGDPVFDLASCASLLDLSAASTRLLCDEYIRAGGSVEQGRVALARWSFDYLQWLWYRVLLSSGSPGPDAVAAAHRVQRIERRLRARASGVLRCNNH